MSYWVTSQVAQKSSRLKLCPPKTELCCQKFLVKLLKILIKRVRNMYHLQNKRDKDVRMVLGMIKFWAMQISIWGDLTVNPHSMS